LWRLSHRPPELPVSIEQAMPRWQLQIYHAMHWAFYALFFLVPLIGWAYSSAAGFQVVLFGLFPLPDWMPHDKALAALIKPWHEISAWTLATLVVLHVAAALKHHFLDCDGLLARMTFKD
jgi:cytochrome b561